MLVHRVQPVLPHKKIHSLTAYIIALTAREPSLWTPVPLSATDLIASGDWTVPREGSSSVLSNNDVSTDSASGLGGLLFQSPFFHVTSSVLDSSLLGTSGV